MESTASSPRGSRLNRVEEDSCSPWQVKLLSEHPGSTGWRFLYVHAAERARVV